MTNVTGTESRKYSTAELLALADDAEERKAPDWVVRELRQQAFYEFFGWVRE